MTCSAPKRLLVIGERVQGMIARVRGPQLAPKTPPFVMWGGRVGVDWRGKTGTVVGPTHNFGPKYSTVQWRQEVPALVAP